MTQDENIVTAFPGKSIKHFCDIKNYDCDHE